MNDQLSICWVSRSTLKWKRNLRMISYQYIAFFVAFRRK